MLLQYCTIATGMISKSSMIVSVILKCQEHLESFILAVFVWCLSIQHHILVGGFNRSAKKYWSVVHTKREALKSLEWLFPIYGNTCSKPTTSIGIVPLLPFGWLSVRTFHPCRFVKAKNHPNFTKSPYDKRLPGVPETNKSSHRCLQDTSYATRARADEME